MLLPFCCYYVSADAADAFAWQDLDDRITGQITGSIAGPRRAPSLTSAAADYPILLDGNIDITRVTCAWWDKTVSSDTKYVSYWQSGEWHNTADLNYYNQGYNRNAARLTYTIATSIAAGSQVNFTFAMYMYPTSMWVNDPLFKIEANVGGTYLDVTDRFAVESSTANIKTYNLQTDSLDKPLSEIRIICDFAAWPSGYKDNGTHYFLCALGGTVYNTQETQLGILAGIRQIFDKISNLPALIMDALKDFVVPSADEMYQIIDDFAQQSGDNLGFVSQSYTLIFEILTDVASISPSDVGQIDFPGITFAMPGDGSYTLVPAQTVNLDPFAGTDFNFIYYVRVLTSALATLGVLNWAWKDFENLISVKTTKEGD